MGGFFASISWVVLTPDFQPPMTYLPRQYLQRLTVTVLASLLFLTEPWPTAFQLDMFNPNWDSVDCPGLHSPLFSVNGWLPCGLWA